MYETVQAEIEYTEPVFVDPLRSPGYHQRVHTEPVFVDLLRSPGIDPSLAAGTKTLFVVLARQAT